MLNQSLQVGESDRSKKGPKSDVLSQSLGHIFNFTTDAIWRRSFALHFVLHCSYKVTWLWALKDITTVPSLGIVLVRSWLRMVGCRNLVGRIYRWSAIYGQMIELLSCVRNLVIATFERWVVTNTVNSYGGAKSESLLTCWIIVPEVTVKAKFGWAVPQKRCKNKLS